MNEIDMSALESLEAINRRLKEIGVALHLSEVKGRSMICGAIILAPRRG